MGLFKRKKDDSTLRCPECCCQLTDPNAVECEMCGHQFRTTAEAEGERTTTTATTG